MFVCISMYLHIYCICSIIYNIYSLVGGKRLFVSGSAHFPTLSSFCFHCSMSAQTHVRFSFGSSWFLSHVADAPCGVALCFQLGGLIRTMRSNPTFGLFFFPSPSCAFLKFIYFLKFAMKPLQIIQIQMVTHSLFFLRSQTFHISFAIILF